MTERTITPDIETNESPNFRTINVNGIFGGHRPMYFEAVLFSDELKPMKALGQNAAPEKSTMKRTLECRLILDPYQAKAIAMWMLNHVNDYEKKFGHIPSPEEIQAKSGRSDLQ
jgi:hypothetical protein